MNNKTLQTKNDEFLSEEILKNEHFRLLVLMTVFLVLTLIAFLVSIVYKDQFDKIFRASDYFLWAISIFLVIVLRSFFIRFRIRKWQKQNYKLPEVWRYLNAFFEVSIPSIGILIIAQGMQSIYALITPIVFLYFIFIILSSLELNLMLSVFTGAVAAVEYFSISLYVIAISDNSAALNTLNFYLPYLAKSIMLLGSGILAGLVTVKVKNHINDSYKMLNERNFIEKIFGQQVSPHIVDELLQHKSEITTRRRFVCIMFLDIRGFTPFAEKKTPEEIINYQNQVFSFMIDRINEHHGIINQFMGDGFMATFGAPIAHENDCQNAVDAALDIINDLTSKNKQKSIPHTKIGIGLHAGQVVTGNVGTFIRKQYSITGNTVILASRLEQLNKKFDSQILISKEVLENIHFNEFHPKFLGRVEIKGRKEPMEIFQIA